MTRSPLSWVFCLRASCSSFRSVMSCQMLMITPGSSSATRSRREALTRKWLTLSFVVIRNSTLRQKPWRRTFFSSSDQRFKALALSCSSQMNRLVSTISRHCRPKNMQKVSLTSIIVCVESVITIPSAEARSSVSKNFTVCRVSSNSPFLSRLLIVISI